MNLDVGYEGPMNGEQSEWIEKTLSESKAKIKMAQYHGPLYTACKQNSPFDQLAMDYGFKYWVPLFDKYNMTIIFENHTHAFKRSKKIKYGKVDDEGTIYLGEGSWGVTQSPGDCRPDNVELHEKVLSAPNAWIIKIDTSKGIQADAYMNDGTQLDSLFIGLN